MAALVAAGRWKCQCDEERLRAAQVRPESARPRPWDWEDPASASYRGCGEEPAHFTVGYHDGEPLARCPARLVESWCWDVLALWPSWEAGALPNSGGVLDQPAPLVDAMSVVAQAVGEERSESAERSRPPTHAERSGGFTARAPVRQSRRGR